MTARLTAKDYARIAKRRRLPTAEEVRGILKPYMKRARPKRQHPEANLHRAVAQYLTLALPVDAVWTTFPAGGGGKIRGGRLKAVGLRPGWPDVQILYRGKFYGPELKSRDGRRSPEQIACGNAIMDAGGYYEIIRSVDELHDWLRMLGVPLRIRATISGGPAKARRR